MPNFITEVRSNTNVDIIGDYDAGGAASDEIFRVYHSNNAANRLITVLRDSKTGIGPDTTVPVSLLEIRDNSANPILTLTAGHASSWSPQIQFRTDASPPTVKASFGVDGANDNVVLDYGSGGVGGSLDFVWNGTGFGIGVAPSAMLHVENVAINSTAPFTGIYGNFVKTLGATNYLDDYYAMQTIINMNQVGGEVGNLFAGDFQAILTDGTVGNAISGVASMYGIRAKTVLNGGTVTNIAYGAHVWVDQAGGSTINDGAGLYIEADFAGTINGTTYMLFLDEGTAVDYGIFQGGSAVNVLGGNTVIGPAIYAAASLLEVYNASAHPIITVTGAHASSWDPQIQFRTDVGPPTVKFSAGVDSADDSFRIAAGAGGVGDDTTFIITSAGLVGIGGTPNDNLEVIDLGTDTRTGILVTTYNDQAAYSPQVVIRKSHSDTINPLVDTIDTEILGVLRFRGVDNTQAWNDGAIITCTQVGVADIKVPTKLQFQTYSSTAANVGFLINEAGNFGFNNAALQATDASFTALQVGGNGYILANTAEGVTAGLWIGQNYYFDGANKRIAASEASRAKQSEGIISFDVAISDAADSAIAWVETLSMAIGTTEFNSGNTDVDFIVNTTVANTLYIEGSSGNIGIGGTPNDNLEVIDLGTNSQSVVMVTTYNDQAAYPSELQFRKSHQDTVGLTDTIDTEILGRIKFRGIDNTQVWSEGAVIVATQVGAAGVTLGTKLQFVTYTSGSANIGFLINESGNFGFNNAALETWHGDFTALQTGGIGSIMATTAAVAGGRMAIANNSYWDVTNNRREYIISSEEATLYEQLNGGHTFYTAATGTADAEISWVNLLGMTISTTEFNSGNTDVDFIVNTTVADTLFIEGSSGNIGFGTSTISSWDPTYLGVHYGGIGAMSSIRAAAAGNAFYMTNNAYFDDTDNRWEYIIADEATTYSQYNGNHLFRVSNAAGTPDAAIGWISTLSMAIGTTEFNSGNTDIDFIVNTTVADSLFIRGSDGNIGIMSNAPVLTDTAFASLDIGGNANLMADITRGASKNLNISQNAYFDDTDNQWEAISTDEAVNIWMRDGEFRVRVSNATPAADALITWVQALTVANDGNVGFGISALETWAATWTALQIGGTGTIFAETTAAASNAIYISENSYNFGAQNLRIIEDEASRYYQKNGIHIHQVAASGVADSVITWVETLAMAIGTTEFNSGNTDIDFIVNTTVADSLFIRGSDGNIGIGTNAPTNQFVLHALAASNPYFLFSDADVTNPFTTQNSNVNAVGYLTSVNSTLGGLYVQGLSAGASQGLIVRGLLGQTDPADTLPAVEFRAGKLTGTTGADMGAAETAFQFASWDGSTEYLDIFGDGTTHIQKVTGGELWLIRADADVTTDDLLGVLKFDTDDGLSTVDASFMLSAYASQATGSTQKGAYGLISLKTTDTNYDAAATDVMKFNADGTVLVYSKLEFTQVDGNEYIDSLNDEYMDYGATTGHRFRLGGEDPCLSLIMTHPTDGMEYMLLESHVLDDEVIIPTILSQFQIKCTVPAGSATMAERTAIHFYDFTGDGTITKTYAFEFESEFLEVAAHDVGGVNTVGFVKMLDAGGTERWVPYYDITSWA